MRFYLTALLGIGLLVWGFSAVRAADVSFVAQATNTGNETTWVVNKPAGTVQNDVLLGYMFFEGGTGTSITPPSGWNLEIRIDNGTSDGLAVYYLVAGATEPADYTWTFGASIDHIAGISTYRNVKGSTPMSSNSQRIVWAPQKSPLL